MTGLTPFALAAVFASVALLTGALVSLFLSTDDGARKRLREVTEAPTNKAMVLPDITPVAGILSETFSTPLSHVNLRAQSWNKKLLAAAAELMPEGATLRTFDLAEIPMDDAEPMRRFEAGELLYREGDPGTNAFLLEDGRVRLIKRVRGVERSLMVLKPGDLFGESALIAGVVLSVPIWLYQLSYFRLFFEVFRSINVVQIYG